MKRRRHVVLIVLVLAVSMAASTLLYQFFPVAAMTLSAGSGALAVAVMAHLGVLTALVAPLVALRRRSRGRRT